MIKIRYYNSNDYGPIKTILEESNLFDDVWDSKKNILSIIENDPEYAIVALENDKVVGCVFIVPYGAEAANLFRLTVKKDKRGAGIGTKLLEHAEDVVRNKGYKEVGLYVDKTDENLKNFYKKRKYVTSGKPYVYMYKPVKIP
ncbi:GNAT family N-acetyltransferase [Patescibacteria group bacterium]